MRHLALDDHRQLVKQGKIQRRVHADHFSVVGAVTADEPRNLLFRVPDFAEREEVAFADFADGELVPV